MKIIRVSIIFFTLMTGFFLYAQPIEPQELLSVMNSTNAHYYNYMWDNWEKVIESLRENPNLILLKNKNGDTLLHLAIKNSMNIVPFILYGNRRGLLCNKKNHRKICPLHQAFLSNAPLYIHLLLLGAGALIKTSDLRECLRHHVGHENIKNYYASGKKEIPYIPWKKLQEFDQRSIEFPPDFFTN